MSERPVNLKFLMKQNARRSSEAQSQDKLSLLKPRLAGSISSLVVSKINDSQAQVSLNNSMVNNSCILPRKSSELALARQPSEAALQRVSKKSDVKDIKFFNKQHQSETIQSKLKRRSDAAAQEMSYIQHMQHKQNQLLGLRKERNDEQVKVYDYLLDNYSLLCFWIINGQIVKQTEDFRAFQRLNQDRWPQIGQLIGRFCKFLSQNNIDQAKISAKLFMKQLDCKQMRQEDYLSCVLTHTKKYSEASPFSQRDLDQAASTLQRFFKGILLKKRVFQIKILNKFVKVPVKRRGSRSSTASG